MPSLERSIRVVAGFEALKGLLALAAASGLLTLLHRDVHAVAVHLVEHAHLNPAARYPGIFLAAAAHLDDARLQGLAAGAAAYSALRFAEAWGLFRGRAWAEILAAASGAIYLPFELVELVRKPGWHGALLLAVNVLIVALMLARLLQRRRRAATSPTV